MEAGVTLKFAEAWNRLKALVCTLEESSSFQIYSAPLRRTSKVQTQVWSRFTEFVNLESRHLPIHYPWVNSTAVMVMVPRK